MKLKTLKDLVFNYIPKVEGGTINIITEERVKQEAIKWVKHDIKLFGKEMGRMANYKFITFFNITKEDLK